MKRAIETALQRKVRALPYQLLSELAMAVTDDPDRLWEILADEVKRRGDGGKREGGEGA